MSNTKSTTEFLGLCCAVLAGALLCGCSSPKTSKLMTEQAAANVPTAAPAGKALVCIHRPIANMGNPLFTGIWDGTNFIADLGNGNSVAYVCEPGKHYFLNRSVDAEACIEAQLLPDKTYDVWVDTVIWTPVVSFKIKPLPQDDHTRRQVAKWNKQNRWVTLSPSAEAYGQHKQDIVQLLLEDFTSGKRHGELQHLAPDDHR